MKSTSQASEAHRKALGKWLGSRDPAHIARWVAAQNAGKEAAPKCVAISKTTGCRCRHVARRGADRCLKHLKGKELDRVDRAHTVRMMEWLENGSPAQQRQARRAMGRMAKRQLHKLWAIDPRAAGATLSLDDFMYRAVADWLRSAGNVEIDKPDFLTGRPLSPRCRDRLLWAGYRVLRRGREATPQFINAARQRVGAALRDERGWWMKYDREAREND